MKVAVLNYSGNVGKSTLAKHLLSPRMNDCKIIAIETINENGNDQDNVKGKNFKEVLIELSVMDNAIVDIGSSNIEQVFIQLKAMADAHEDFDYYIVPTVPSPKQQADTMNLLAELETIGIDLSKIKVVFNQVEPDETVETTFPKLAEYCAKSGIPTDAIVYSNDLFSMLKSMPISEAVGKAQEIKDKMALTDDLDEKRRLATLLTISRLAKGVQKNLDDAFKALFR